MKKAMYATLISVFLLNIICSAQILKIDDLSININGEAELISIKKNGEIAVGQKVVGKMLPNGSLQNLDGKTMITVDKQGKVTDLDKNLFGLVDKTGNVDFGSGKKIGWTKDGKFAISDKDVLTISPKKKKYYQTASVLILLNYYVKSVDSSPIPRDSRFTYKATDVIAGIYTNSGSRYPIDYSLVIYGNGTIAYTVNNNSNRGGETLTTLAKIEILMQKIDELTFKRPEMMLATPHVHDALSYTMYIRHKGELKKIDWSTGSQLTDEMSEFYTFVTTLFAPEISK